MRRVFAVMEGPQGRSERWGLRCRWGATLSILLGMLPVASVWSADGVLDPGFGNGGVALTHFPPGEEFAESVAVQSDGRIVVAGRSFNGSNNDFALVRYHPDGSLDSSFDGDGKQVTDLGGDDFVNSLALQSDGKIVVAGYSEIDSTRSITLARYLANGRLDSSFDGDGQRVLEFAADYNLSVSVALQSDGKIIVAGHGYKGAGGADFAIARLNSNGSLDVSFDGDGQLFTDFGGSYDYVESVAVQGDGRIVAVGRSYNGSSYDVALARYNPDGSLDASFDGDGKQTTDFGNGDESAYAIALQSDGKIVLVGDRQDLGNRMWVLGRYRLDGSLDGSFDGDGKLVVDFGDGYDQALAVTLQANGRIVVAGNASSEDFVLVRFNADGSLDGSFDIDGKLGTDFGSRRDWATAVALQGDGKLVAVGGSYDGSIESAGHWDFAMARYLSDGRLDSALDEDGKVVTDAFQGLGDVNWSAIAQQDDGRIVAVGGSCYQSHGCDFALARYLADGGLDGSFDGDGKLSLAFGAGIDYATSVVVQGDGKLVVAGSGQLEGDGPFGGKSVFALARFNPDGRLDSSFDGDGKLIIDFGDYGGSAFALALQGDGKIVVAGTNNNGTSEDYALARVNTDGSLDAEFSGDGKLTTDFNDQPDNASSVAVQADGKIVVSGTSYDSSSGPGFALARFNGDGSPDSSFDVDGKLTAVLGGGEAYAWGMALQDDGRIVVAGGSLNGADLDFALARFDPDGGLDSSFGEDGKVTLGIGNGWDAANSVALRSDGKIVVAGYSEGDVALARFHPDGRVDASFDGDGKMTTRIGGGESYAAAVLVPEEGNVYAAGHAEAAGGALLRYLSPAPPGAPRIGNASARDRQATVSFAAPAHNGGSAITGYTATSVPGGLVGRCAASPCTVSGLTNGTSYVFSVFASNSAGNGPSSAFTGSVVPMGTQAITMADIADLIVGGTAALSATGGGSNNPVVFSASPSIVCSVSGSTLTALSTGDCRVAANQAGSASYHPAPEVTQSVSVVAVPPGVPPVPVNDFYALASGRSTTIPASVGVLVNDQFEIGASGRALSSLEGGPQHGAMSLDPDGGFFYSPNPGFEGSDSFNYRACVGDVCSAARVDLSVQSELSATDQYLWLAPPASNAQQQGFIRLSNRGGNAGTVAVWGIDASGRRSAGTITLDLVGRQSIQFNSIDLEQGNAAKGLSGALGAGEGTWLLIVRSELDIDALAYIRTPDGFVTSIHDRAEGNGVDWVVPMFNPASNLNQVSRLRVVNSTLAAVDVRIAGIDDAGQPGQGTITTTLPPLASREYDATDIEQGNLAKGLIGQFGDGVGKWRLTVSATGRVTVQSLLVDPMGYLTNLSTFSTSLAGSEQVLWKVTSAAETQQQGFLRLTNLSDRNGTVTLWGVDDRGRRSPGTATLALQAGESKHLNSQDLELGNPDKGLSGSLGDGEGGWRIFLSTDLDLLPMGLIRTPNGFVTTMHDLVLETARSWRVPMFNPGSNPNQVSVLRVVNPGNASVEVGIAGVDDAGQSGPAGNVGFTLPANVAVEFTALELEQGSADRGLVGKLGDGEGKWVLQVNADAEVKVISMLRDPSGYLTNLSSETKGGAAALEP